MLDLGLFLEYTQSQRQKRATATANTAAANGDGSNTEGVHASEANNTSVCRRIAGPGSEEVEVSRAVAAQAASMATSPLYTALMDQLGVALLAHVRGVMTMRHAGWLLLLAVLYLLTHLSNLCGSDLRTFGQDAS
jgi:hypothetical protein